MTDANREGTLYACVCGHVEAHHNAPARLGYIDPHPTRCEWIGCGCPRFIASLEPSDD